MEIVKFCSKLNWKNLNSNEILKDVLQMKTDSINSYFYGPWNLEVPIDYKSLLQKEYGADKEVIETVNSRICKIYGIEDIIINTNIRKAELKYVGDTDDDKKPINKKLRSLQLIHISGTNLYIHQIINQNINRETLNKAMVDNSLLIQLSTLESTIFIPTELLKQCIISLPNE